VVAGGSPERASQQVSFQVNRAARYVKIQLNGQGIEAGGLVEVEVKCPAGKKALSGGIADPSTRWAAMVPIETYRSYPIADGSGWSFLLAIKNYDGTVALYVVCAKL
jgi:hypothetical protein